LLWILDRSRLRIWIIMFINSFLYSILVFLNLWFGSLMFEVNVDAFGCLTWRVLLYKQAFFQLMRAHFLFLSDLLFWNYLNALCLNFHATTFSVLFCCIKTRVKRFSHHLLLSLFIRTMVYALFLFELSARNK